MTTAAVARGADQRRGVHRLRKSLSLALPGAMASVLLLAGIVVLLQAAAESRTMESGWNALLLDRHGQLLVATPPAAELNAVTARHWLAQVLPPNALALLGTINPAGVPARVASARAGDAEWTAAVEVPLAIVDAPVHRATRNLALGGGLLFALGAVAGGLLARWWQRPIDELSVAAAHGESERREAEAQVEHLRGLLRASSDALPARLAILDARGNLAFSNEAWRNFARSRRDLNGGQNANCLTVCEAPVLRDTLRRLMKGKRRTANITYRVEGQSEDIWCRAHLSRFEHQDNAWYVVAHEDITEIKALRQTVRHLTDRLGRLQEEERHRLARELHDSTAQHLVGIGLNLMRLRSVLSGSAAAEEIYHVLSTCLKEAQKELRLFTYLLYPPNMGNEGLEATAERFVDGFATRAGLRVRRRICCRVDRVSFDVQCATFRILKEALTNVHRHAAANRVLVLLCTTEHELRLLVKDNGKGLGARGDTVTGRDVPLGIGIPAMRARAHQLGGILTVTSGRRGTVVRASVPLRRPRGS
jgi:signal transduction histidine kinase